MINRLLEKELLQLSEYFPVVTVTGPRQSGKTTLCKMAFPDFEYVTLEDIATRNAIQSDTRYYLEQHSKGLIIDEAQNLPELFSYIQVVVDEDRTRRYILTGSSNFALLSEISQSLAGRVGILTLLPLSYEEIGNADISTETLLLRGGYPAIWAHNIKPYDFYSNFHSTYVERDLRQIANIRYLSTFHDFTRLSAARTSGEFIASNFSNMLDVDYKTIQAWDNKLETSHITFKLHPYSRNIGKRTTKTPKRYFYDTGLLCYLLGIEEEKQLEIHPLKWAIFENYVVVEMLKKYYNRGRVPSLYFYRDKSQKEVDIVEDKGYQNIHIYEIKAAHSYNANFTKGLEYFRKLYEQDVTGSTVIYDGKEKFDSQFNGYINFREL